EFENNIYPTEIGFFGEPDFHDGSNSLLVQLGYVPEGYYDDTAGRQVVLVANIRDDNYYDPNYPLYIAGFYSGALEAYFDRNTMSIDAYDWENRTGPDAPRPYLYEGVFAHEYQHLLHDDYDGDEETWVNEGLSDLAQFLTGYGHPDSHVADTAERPENSLVAWGDQGPLEILSDYGHAYLFMLYLLEQYGPGAIQELFHNPANGMSGVQATLDAMGSERDFGAVYRDYAVALLIDSPRGGREYEFQNIDINLNIGTPDSPNPEAFSMPGAPPWGTDYRWVDAAPNQRLLFDGADHTSFPTAWSSDGDVLWSGSGNSLDNWAIFETTGGGTLSFDTMYEIEELRNFGFVQVSTDGGQTWTSLSNEYTTSDHDPNILPKIVDNLPGLTGSTGGAWINMSFGLGAYAGQHILIAFRYITELAAAEGGWYVDNIYVDDTLISDGSSTEPFRDITEIIPIENDFMVTLIGVKRLDDRTFYKVVHLTLDDVKEKGYFDLYQIMSTSSHTIMLVTYAAPEGVTSYADYSYEFARIVKK
ncbi:MAG TPA: choice-of-anchor J domain-containing protein, partial [Candidatus Binatia bacterium]|nr:choice-of-anchor J domain-containing protein [Candidatus Binatia bacterium]